MAPRCEQWDRPADDWSISPWLTLRLTLPALLRSDVRRYYESPRPFHAGERAFVCVQELYARASRRDRVAQPQEGAPARPRTRRRLRPPCLGPHVHIARAGSPLADRRCSHTHAGSASAARKQTPGGSAYKRRGISRSDVNRPSSRFPMRSLQPNGGSTPAEAKPTRSELVGGQAWARTGT
jgi:hypothetical protein